MSNDSVVRGVMTGLKGGLTFAAFFSAIALVIAQVVGERELQATFGTTLRTMVTWYFVLGAFFGAVVGALLRLVDSEEKAVALSCATMTLIFAATIVTFFPRSKWLGGALGAVLTIGASGPMVGRTLYSRYRGTDADSDSDPDASSADDE